MMAGYYSEIKEANEEIKILANEMKEKVENVLGETFLLFKPILFTNKVISGTNYNIKIQVGEHNYIHIKVHVPLDIFNSPNEILECELNMNITDPLIL